MHVEIIKLCKVLSVQVCLNCCPSNNQSLNLILFKPRSFQILGDHWEFKPVSDKVLTPGNILRYILCGWLNVHVFFPPKQKAIDCISV